MKAVFNVLLTLGITIALTKITYKLGWIGKAIDHPLGYKLYVTLRHMFGAVGSEEAEDVILGFTLCLAMIIASTVVFFVSRIAQRYKEDKQ